MTDDLGKGIIDCKSRALEELLRKTAFKDGLRYALQNIDPHSSPKLVRALLSTDIEVTLALASSLPAVANAVILALDELMSQVREKFPPALLNDFVLSLLEDIDREALARVVTGAHELGGQLSPIFKSAWNAAERLDKEAG